MRETEWVYLCVPRYLLVHIICRRLSDIVSDPIDLHPRAPEAMEGVPSRDKTRQIQTTPAVQTNTAEYPQYWVSFVFAVWP